MCSPTEPSTSVLLLFPLRTLFKFVKKFEEALSGPSVPALVEQGGSAGLDSVDANPEETPIHRVHRALRSAPPGKGRDLQVHVSHCFQNKLISSIPLLCLNVFDSSNKYRCLCIFQLEDPMEGVEAASLQGRLPALTRRMKKMCIQLLQKHPVPELAEDLDCFTGRRPRISQINTQSI